MTEQEKYAQLAIATTWDRVGELELETLYWDLGMTRREIAEQYKVSVGTVNNRIYKYNLGLRRKPFPAELIDRIQEDLDDFKISSYQNVMYPEFESATHPKSWSTGNRPLNFELLKEASDNELRILCITYGMLRLDEKSDRCLGDKYYAELSSLKQSEILELTASEIIRRFLGKSNHTSTSEFE